jgi:cytochrome c peroxidase
MPKLPWLPVLALAVATPIPALAQIGPPPPPPLQPPPVPPQNPLTEAKRLLGKALFFEEQLSSDDTVACATCHVISAGGSDPRLGIDPGNLLGPPDDVRGSPGVVRADGQNRYLPHLVFGLEPQVTSRASPTMIAAAYAPELFWDGRARGSFSDPAGGQALIPVGGALENQALAPLTNSIEMAHDQRGLTEVLAKLAVVRPLALASDLPPDLAAGLAGAGGYADLFQAAFGDPAISAQRVAFALATYQRTLVPNLTPFDAFVAGQPGALTPSQAQGLQAFNATTCNVCHAGPLFSNHTFRNVGLRPWQEDPGRLEVTGLFGDRGRFKVPTLRNVGLKPRFMHTGQFATLEQVIGFYVGGPGFQQFPENQDPAVPAINVPPQLRDELADFLRNGLTDPRVRDELFPFDRPTLASERKASEQSLIGSGHPGTAGVTPRWISPPPAALGSPDFKLGLREALPQAAAFLGISLGQAPGGLRLGAAPLAVDPSSLLQLVALATSPGPTGFGHGTAQLPLPSNPALSGIQVVAQWVVLDSGAAGQWSATPGLRFPLQ